MTAQLDDQPFPNLLRGDHPYRDLWILLILGGLIFSAGLGFKDPWPADEPRYALVAVEMVETGNWLIPHRAGEIYPDKPPIFFWSVASVYLLTGSIRLAHLLPSILSGLLILTLVWDLARRLWGRSTAAWTVLVLLMVIQFPLQMRAGQIDALLCLWTTLGLYGFCRHLLLGPNWRWLWLGFFALGLGVITKGVGFLPLLLFLPYAIARHQRWPGLPELGSGGWRHVVGPVLMLTAIGLWLVPVLLMPDTGGDLGEYRADLLWHQTADRYTNSWGHLQPPWFFVLERIPMLWWPMSWLFPWLIPAWWQRLRNRDPRFLILLSWSLMVLLFFSLSPGKRGVYLLPIVPALAWVTGPLADQLWRRKGVQHMGLALLASLTAVLSAVLVVGLNSGAAWAEKVQADFGPGIWPLVGVLALIGVAATLWSVRLQRGLGGLAAFLFCAWMLLGWSGYRVLNPGRSSALFMEQVSRVIGPSDDLALVEWREQFVLHSDRPVTHFGFLTPPKTQQARSFAWLAAESGRWVLMPESSFGQCVDASHAVFVAERHRQRWSLIGKDAVTPKCLEDSLSLPDARTYLSPWPGKTSGLLGDP